MFKAVALVCLSSHFMCKTIVLEHVLFNTRAILYYTKPTPDRRGSFSCSAECTNVL